MADKKADCEQCGSSHEEDMFSDEIALLATEIASTNDPMERRQLLVELVEAIAEDVDDFRIDMPTLVHDLLDDVAATRLNYERAILRAARVLYPAVEHELQVRPRNPRSREPKN